MAVVLAALLIALGASNVMGSPAAPVDQEMLTVVVDSAEPTTVASPADSRATTDLLRVEGWIVDEAASRWPDRMVAGDTPVVVRLRPAGLPRLGEGDVLRLVTVPHTVTDDQPTHFVEDVVTSSDLGDEALVAVARANPRVPFTALARSQQVLTGAGVPYTERGFTTLAEWEIDVTFTPRPSANELARQVYDVAFVPATGRVAAEWTLTLDLDRGEVNDLVVFEIEPEPEPDPGE